MLTDKDVLRKGYDKYPMAGAIDPYDGGKDTNEERREGYMQGLFDGYKERLEEENATIDTAITILESPTIKGWVARDKVENPIYGLGLCLHSKKLWRTGNEWSNQTIAMHLPADMFPEVTWESEPKEVELYFSEV